VAQADTLTYFNKLEALRASQPVVSGPSYAVRQCNAGNMSGDAIYTYRCPAAWLEFGGDPNAQSAQLVFPRDYFTWVQNYLRAALAMRPSSTSSSEFKVVWALDCWAHVNYALFAFPFPWSDIYSGGIAGVPELALLPVIFGTGPKSIGAAASEVAAWAVAKADFAKTAATTAIRDAAVNSRLCPSPFSELVVQWAAAPGARSPLYQHPSPIWPLLLAAMQPWSSTWAAHWIASHGDKDRADLKRYASDPALLRACMQWRLWSVQDWGYSGSDPSYWPLGMGKANSVVSLSTYLAHARGEATAPKITFYGTQAYPNLAFGLDAVADHVRTILGASYDVVLQTHLNMWLAQSSPRLAADGSFAKRSDGAIARQPVTRTDYADYFKGLLTNVTARTRIALANPALTCDPSDAQCLKSVEFGAKVQQAVASSPLAPFQNSMQRIADKLVSLIGGAVGGGYEPFFVVRDPFSRTFTGAGYRLLADGATADLYYRLGVAITRYRDLLPGLFTATVTSVVRTARAACAVWWTRAGNACEICEGQPRPACAADVPDLPPPTPAVTQHGSLPCEEDWQKFVTNSPYRYVVTAADKQMHTQICSQLASGSWSLIQASNAWKGYLENKYGKNPRPSLFTLFKQGFIRSSNPLR
jgi:hypothetical protein